MDNEEVVDDYTRAVAAVLKKAQQERGPSYTDLAEATGLGRATVERILNGKRDITTRYLRTICAALGLNAADVLNEAESSN